MRIDINSPQVEVCSLKYAYKEFVCIFSKIIALYSMALVPKYIVYILHHSIHEKAMVEWDCIISNEVLFQLGSLRKTKKIYINSYFVFVIVYCHIFGEFPKTINVDFKKELASIGYQVLWRHKSPYNFYAVQNGFLSSFKKMIHGPTT
jgi:hypothetical protein